MLPEAIIANEPHFYHVIQTEDRIQVYASPLVAGTDPVWLVVSSRLACRPYVELPSETYEDPDMMFGQATLYTFAFA